MSGYIYIRKHESYEKYQVVKLGKAENIKSRETSYVTGEIKRGTYILVVEMEKSKIDIVEKMLQNYFKSHHFYLDGGVEFYKDSIINELVDFLNTIITLKFRVLTTEELNSINRPIRKKIDAKKLIEYLYFEASKPLTPLPHQKEILDIIESFYEKNNIGKLLWACGLGKALTSILIVEKLKCKTVVVGLPSEYLQKQFYNEILRVFPNKENILCIGGKDSDKDEIYSFYEKESNECKFFVTTYSSCHYLNKEDLTFDFKIGDEAHHLTGKSRSAEDFIKFHKIQSKKTLYLTATEKIIDVSDSETIYSMDNKEQFGVVIGEPKSVKWAIENKKITDYQVLILQNNEEEINSIIERLNVRISNKNLFISAFMSLKSIEKYKDLTHIVLYTNKTENADLVKDYIEKILDLNVLKIDKSKFYNNSLHSNNTKNLEEETKEFKKYSYGIISCVYIFGEGFDLPKLNGVAFAENMESTIRIVQSALRPNRLDKFNIHKKAYMIIPHISGISDSFENCIKIISKLGNVDETITQKIKLLNLKDENDKPDMPSPSGKIIYSPDIILKENIKDLELFKLELIKRKALRFDFSIEEAEYQAYKKINKSLNIDSFDMYNKHNLLPNPETYFTSKSINVWKGYYDFWNFDTNNFIKTKDLWKEKCEDLKISNLAEYNEKTKIYNFLPKEPSEFYKDFSSIGNELSSGTKRRK